MRSNVPAYEMRVPKSVVEVLDVLAAEPGVWRPFAGGTDLMVLFEAGKLDHRRFLSIWRLPELRGIWSTAEVVTLGALTTYTDVLRHEALSREFPLLAEAARNTGGIARMQSGLFDRLNEIHVVTGRKVSIVGWSLGGIYARHLALQAPNMVRCVVTLGSPFANDVRATNATRLYEALSGETVEQNSELQQAIAGDLPVPTTSIYSRSDGIVNWRTCVLKASDTAENIEVRLASHVGLGVNAAALWALADRLAQPEDQFAQFDRSGPFAIAYAPAEHAQSV